MAQQKPEMEVVFPNQGYESNGPTEICNLYCSIDSFNR